MWLYFSLKRLLKNVDENLFLLWHDFTVRNVKYVYPLELFKTVALRRVKLNFSLTFELNLAKLGSINWIKSKMPDLQLNMVAFAKLICLTQQNLALIYTATFKPSLIQISSSFFMGL